MVRCGKIGNGQKICLQPLILPKIICLPYTKGLKSPGTLKPELAKKWSMQAVPIIAGGGDNAAGAAGIGVINPNEAFLSLGTSGVYFVANESYRPNPDSTVHTFCHCIDNTWHQMSVILAQLAVCHG